MKQSIVMAVAVLALAACGGDNNGSNNGASNNGASNNGASNNGASNNGGTDDAGPADCRPAGEFLGSCESFLSCRELYAPEFDATTAEMQCVGSDWRPGVYCEKTRPEDEPELIGCCFDPAATIGQVRCDYNMTGMVGSQDTDCEAAETATWCGSDRY